MSDADDRTRAWITLLGLPHDANSSFLHGPAQAPPLIRTALKSDSGNSWTETGHDLARPGVLADAGDVDLQGEADPWQRIEFEVGRVMADGSAPLCLGGDHAVSWPVIRAAARRLGPLDVLHFDAHPDLYPDQEGNRRGHGSVMARVAEDEDIGRLVQVGIRTINAIQRRTADELGVEVHLLRDGPPPLELEFQRPVWISFDLDGLDPAFAPGVSHFEPGGLSTRRALDIIHGFRGRLIGADVVEFNPLRDRSGMTAMVAAKLVKELAGRILADRGAPPDL